MRVEIEDKIGIANPRTAVKAYRKNPSNFTLAANAAAHYAQQYGDYLVIPGNSYMQKVYHLTPKDTPNNAVIPAGLGTKFVKIAVVKPDGNVYMAKLYEN